MSPLTRREFALGSAAALVGSRLPGQVPLRVVDLHAHDGARIDATDRSLFAYCNAIEYLNIPGFIARHQRYNPSFLTPAMTNALQALT